MITILFACRNFNNMAGGVERMASIIMNEMVRRGHKVTLLTWDPKNSKSYYDLSPEINWQKLDLGSPYTKASWKLRLKRQLSIRKIVKEINPTVLIGFQVGTFIAVRLALLGLFIPTIAAERNSPDLYNYVKNGKKHRFFAFFALLFANVITVQFESYKKKYPFFLRSRILTISNPVYPNNNPAFPNEKIKNPKIILNVGRLSYQKNQLLLIKAFSLISSKYPKWNLKLVGEGEYRKKLELFIDKYGLSQRIQLIGAIKDVDYWYQNSSFFVFPSLWEGFPNALVEAFREGLPAIGLASTSGVNQLIKNKRNGFLVKCDENAFASAMEEMINNESFRKKAGKEASFSIQKYPPNIIFDHWENLFLNLSENK
mgnify:CR=1 FL=1